MMADNSLEQLINKAKNGDVIAMDVLLKKYSYLVRKRANGLFLIGADKDDLLQEGMIGLFKAVISYNEEKDASFDTFASLCINRQMISAIRGANRYKHKLLNEYISIYSDENQQETQYAVSIPDNKFNPENIITQEETIEHILSKISSRLSKMESDVFDLLIEGQTITFMCKTLEKDAKSIDNAIQRVKNKVRNILKEEH
ncbi:MAG: sigma-70 family RNA polymerase sigma factor [Clostridia bacterium]|nr:sigma-70 family RNA polymerase sigma factor [Clostridia bacterium]MDD3093075.1 sigma-70 family RNA polymerase sigma factor [Clostridia bacterium]